MSVFLYIRSFRLPIITGLSNLLASISGRSERLVLLDVTVGRFCITQLEYQGKLAFIYTLGSQSELLASFVGGRLSVKDDPFEQFATLFQVLYLHQWEGIPPQSLAIPVKVWPLMCFNYQIRQWKPRDRSTSCLVTKYLAILWAFLSIFERALNRRHGLRATNSE